MTTVDGYYEGPNQEFDWPVVDDEFNEFSERQLDEADMLLFGRVTYEGIAAYWPTGAAQEDGPRVAARMNGLSKIVVSRSLDKAEWASKQLVKGGVAEQINELKRQPGKDIAILGSPSLTVSLLQLGLVDELRIMVTPVALGDGRSLVRTADERFSLKLLKTREFRSGNVLLTYQPAAR
ncbi:dihydrofolate reductase family protein [Micromonospora sp. IBHARD004]|uniref:dihydrofolate reductase family protein n=1 Tax=Micromonospora sp. IBHARD004 TaxID=3457764 RepID=UPI00405867B5